METWALLFLCFERGAPMMTTLIAFFVGLFIGGFVMMLAMALGIAAKDCMDEEA